MIRFFVMQIASQPATFGYGVLRVLLILLVFGTPLPGRNRIAYIEFFGYTGIDVNAVREALPFHSGDNLSNDLEEQARTAVKQVTGRYATDFSKICCTGDGDSVVFIGLAGSSSRAFRFNPSPEGNATAPAELSVLCRMMDETENEALENGHAEEDGSPGYRLMKEPAARAAELAVRKYVLRHQDEVIRVLESSGKRNQRATAADALGYGTRNARQMASLVRAARDPDSVVRNNATRALGEILRADPSAGREVPPDTFIDMVLSGTWTDRNKGCMTLWPLTQSRDPKMLGQVKAEAEDALLEIALWRNVGWAFCARAILGRIAGIPEEQLNPLALGPLDAFTSAIGR
jgi:hypothetical protein